MLHHFPPATCHETERHERGEGEGESAGRKCHPEFPPKVGIPLLPTERERMRRRGKGKDEGKEKKTTGNEREIMFVRNQ